MRALAGQEKLLRHDVARRQQLADVAASLEAFRARGQHGLATATFEQRRQLVLLLIDRVIVTDAEVEIRYVLPTSPGSEHVQFCLLRKDYFDHPPSGQEGKAACARVARDDLEPHALLGRRTGGGLALVAAIGPRVRPQAGPRTGFDQPQPGKAPTQPATDQRQAITILDVGGMDHQHQQQAQRVDQNVPLAPIHLLAGVPRSGLPAGGQASPLGPPASVVLTL